MVQIFYLLFLLFLILLVIIMIREFLSKDNDQDDIQIVKDIYIQRLQGSSGDLSPAFQELYNNLLIITLSVSLINCVYTPSCLAVKMTKDT